MICRERKLWSATGLCVAFALGIGLPNTAGAAPTASNDADDPTPLDPFEAGLQAYERKAFEDAITLFEDAYAREPRPVVLYAWAQATREAGDCPRAIELYRQFLATGVEGEAADAARENISRCEEEAPTVVTPPVTVTTEDRTAPPANEETTAPVHTAPPLASAAPRKPSPLGVALVAVGGLGTIGGATLIAIAEARRARQSNANDYAGFDKLDRSIDTLHISGGVVLGLGVGLLVGGIVKLALDKRRRSIAFAPRVGSGGVTSFTLSFGL